MELVSVQVLDTNRNSEKDVVLTFNKNLATVNYSNEDDFVRYATQIKTAIENQMPRFQDNSTDDFTIFETVEGHEMMDEWSLSLDEYSINTDEDYDKTDAYEVKFVLDIVETYDY